MNRALVLDGRSRATITIVRSLGEAGINVDVGDEFRTYSTYSKYCSKSIIYPSAKSSPDLFISFMKNLLEEGVYDAIIPVRDHTTGCLVKLNTNGVYEKFLCLPNRNDYELALNKSKTIKIAENLEIPCPSSIPLTSDINYKELYKVVVENFSFPVLLKPSYSSGSRGILKINNINELKDKLEIFIKSEKQGILQEFIPHGGSYGVELLYLDGKPKAKFTHKRLREYPLNGGPSTFRCSYKYPEIESYATKLLNYLNWNGVAMVEFRVDAKTGIPKLMEINPRFWGSLSMAYHAGVDFPKLLYNLITKRDCQETFDYKLNVKTRWLLWGEVLWFFAKIKRLSIPNGFLNIFNPNIHDDIISKNDLLPVWGLIIDSLKTMFSLQKLNHIFKRGL